MSSVVRVDGNLASIPVPPLSSHSESPPSENTRLRKRLKHSSLIRSSTVSDESDDVALRAASLIAASTPAAVG